MEPISEKNSLEEKYQLHETCQKFLQKKGNLAFADLMKAVELVGFDVRQRGSSHQIAKHPTYQLGPPYYDTLNFQEFNGKAKRYQVEQFVDFVRNAQPKKVKYE